LAVWERQTFFHLSLSLLSIPKSLHPRQGHLINIKQPLQQNTRQSDLPGNPIQLAPTVPSHPHIAATPYPGYRQTGSIAKLAALHLSQTRRFAVSSTTT